jgi:hypothetical protein
MPTEREVHRLARAFERVYPETLPERLQWWSDVLGIDRVRFLRVLGMTQEEANASRAVPWSEILKTREDQGWWVDGALGELLALFSYDWKAFASWFHQNEAQARRAGGRNLRATLPGPGGWASLAALIDALIDGETGF